MTKQQTTFRDALKALIPAPTIVKRELVRNGRIRATDSNGIMYLSVDTKATLEGSFVDTKTKKTFSPCQTELQTNDMLNANRDVKSFSNTYQRGLQEERRVIEFLKTVFKSVTNSTKDQNRLEDIDCFINGIPVSIKAEHSGLRYGNIYFELENQITATGNWEKDGWYYTGKAEKYVIIQGQTITMYSKQAIVDYVEANGWLRTRTLGWSTRATQGGTYRTMDTLSGFLETDLVPFEMQWKVC